MADVLLASGGELAPILTAEQGKPLADANIEVFAAAIWCQYFANLETPPQVIQDDAEALVEVVRRPVGVVAAITPWNFPLTLAFWKIAPALLAGNTLVLKPSPFTPLTTLKAAELLRDVMPPGVLNVVSGGDELGAWMTGAPGAAQGQLHRLHRDGQEGGHVGRARPQAGHPRARRQRPGHRAGRRRPGRGGQGHLRRGLQQQRPGVLGHQAGLRARVDLRRCGRRPGRPGRRDQGGRRDRAGHQARARSTTSPQFERVQGTGRRRPLPRGHGPPPAGTPWTGRATSSSRPS